MLRRKGKIFKICKMETRSSRLKSNNKLNFQVVKVYFKNENFWRNDGPFLVLTCPVNLLKDLLLNVKGFLLLWKNYVDFPIKYI